MPTLDQSWITGDGGNGALGYGGREYYAQQITLGVAGPVSQVDLSLDKYGSPTGNMSVTLYSDNGSNLPNAAISDSVTLSVSTLTSGSGHGEWCTFSFTTKPEGTVGMKIWIVAYYDGNNTNYVQLWGKDAGGYSGGVEKYGANLSSMTTVGDAMFKEYYDAPAAATYINMPLLNIG